MHWRFMSAVETTHTKHSKQCWCLVRRVQSGEARFCQKCARHKPPRAHHCRVCRRCVLRMDHHCPWINNCVCALILNAAPSGMRPLIAHSA